MVLKLNQIPQAIFIFFVLFITTFSNYFLNIENPATSSFSISIGFTFGFYLYYRNKGLPFIILSLFSSHLISILIFTDNLLAETLLRASGLTIISILAIYILVKICDLFNIDKSITYRNSLIFVFFTILISVLAGILITNLMIVSNSSYNIGPFFLRSSLEYFFGIMTFGSLIFYAYHYNERVNTSIGLFSFGALFLSMFLIISSLMFSNAFSWFTYELYSFVFILFYIILSFRFSFKAILLTNIIYMLVYQLFYIKLGSSTVTQLDFTIMNLYLLVLSSFAVFAKTSIYELAIRNKALIESQKKLENLVYSTESLLKLSDDILDNDLKVQEDYLARIFKIACNIFDNYDFASCYIKEDPYVNFVDSFGYDTDILNSLNIKSLRLDNIDTENPMHIVNGEKSVVSALEGNYSRFAGIYPKVAESIRFGIYIDKDTIGGISFDITKESKKKFVKDEFENLKSFQKLMNSFFSINYLNYKNISLKNDIVLSLIRTLELFDQYTGGHSEEVAYLSNEIAKRCELDENEMHDIYWAGVVHDIGKVGVDSSIINKPSRLSLEEYETIKQHSMFGYEILNKADDLKTIAILVKHHHEWWNGSGYPDGLKGDKIPLGSQIISICDAVSTMAKKRPYTIVKTSREIIDELEMYQGIQFSPEPTQRMIEFIKEGFLDNFYKNR